MAKKVENAMDCVPWRILCLFVLTCNSFDENLSTYDIVPDSQKFAFIWLLQSNSCTFTFSLTNDVDTDTLPSRLIHASFQPISAGILLSLPILKNRHVTFF